MTDNAYLWILLRYNSVGNTQQTNCCASLPSANAEQVMLKKGCELFTQWGWTTGNPAME